MARGTDRGTEISCLRLDCPSDRSRGIQVRQLWLAMQPCRQFHRVGPTALSHPPRECRPGASQPRHHHDYPSSTWARVTGKSFQGNTFGVGMIVTQKSMLTSGGRPLADCFHSIHKYLPGVFGFAADRVRSAQGQPGVPRPSGPTGVRFGRVLPGSKTFLPRPADQWSCLLGWVAVSGRGYARLRGNRCRLPVVGR